MKSNGIRVQKLLYQAWGNTTGSIRKMAASAQVRPTAPADVFQMDESAKEDEVRFNVGPVVFKIPEKPSNRDTDLYVVVRGLLCFEMPDDKGSLLRTRKFATKVAYFRSKTAELDHVFGAHYDMDEVHPGHPVFHAQIDTYVEFHEEVVGRFRVNATPNNRMSNLLKTVRVPSAQMDFFSVVTQICADHLIDKNSGAEVLRAFRDLRAASSCVCGAAYRMEYLNSQSASSCYRARHWYDTPATAPSPSS